MSRTVLRAAIALILLFALAPQSAWAAYPAPWPDNGNGDVTANWTVYTYKGAAAKDVSNGEGDGSKGAAPAGATDITSRTGTVPSVYYMYDAVNQVLFFRLRLAGDPLASNPLSTNNGNQFSAVTYSLLIDTDGDAFKEFVLTLAGDSGGPSNNYDDIYVFYDNTASQLTPESARVNTYKAATTGPATDLDGRANVMDFGRTRVIDNDAGTDWFIDIQVPLSAFNVGGDQKITETTPIAFGYSSANSNANPLQKDIMYDGVFAADATKVFPFGDPLTLDGGILQDPVLVSIATNGNDPATVSARIIDTVDVTGGTAKTTVDFVDFWYQPDTDGDGTPDVGSTPVYIGRDNDPDAADIGLWEISWDTINLPNGQKYIVWAVATDDQANEGTSNTVIHTVTHTGYAVTGFVYKDEDQSNAKNGAEAGTGINGLFVKVAPQAGGDAIRAVAVNATTGAYEAWVPNGTYKLIVDNNATYTDTTAYLPAGWIGTEAPAQLIENVTVSGANVTGKNFGLYSSGYSVSGTVYGDGNHNAQIDAGESGTGIAGLYVKAVPGAGGDAISSTTVNAATGAFELTAIPNGTYTLIVDNNGTLTDVTAYRPTEWIGTEAPAQSIANVTVSGVAVTGQDFGLWHGAIVQGTVFADTGAGGATANDGAKGGGEAGLPGVTVKATDAAGTTLYDTTVTDGNGAYTLWVPSAAGTGTVHVTQTNLGTYASIGGSAGTTSGAYTRATDTTAYTNVLGTTFTGVNFADVPPNAFTADGSATAVPGAVVFHSHTFTAATGGQVSFTTANASSPATPTWSHVLYRDMNGNGAVDAGEAAVTNPVTVAAGETVALVVKVFVPATAQYGAQDRITVTAAFTYTNASPALQATYVLQDHTSTLTEGAVTLQKGVDKATALPGEVLTYTITYANVSGVDVTAFVINDATPAYTTFASAANGALPAGLTGCAITKPSVGATGSITWTFTGELRAGATGTVTYQVTVE